MIRGLGYRRSGMLKSYSVEYILLKVVFFKKKLIYVVKSNCFKIPPPPPHEFDIPNKYIMYEYTETESKYTGEIGTHSMWGQMYIIT